MHTTCYDNSHVEFVCVKSLCSVSKRAGTPATQRRKLHRSIQAYSVHLQFHRIPLHCEVGDLHCSFANLLLVYYTAERLHFSVLEIG